MRGINLDDRDLVPRPGTLVTPLSRDPGVKGRERALERLHLADGAALFVAVTVKGKQALLTHQFFHRFGLREINLNRNSIPLPNFVDELISLGVQPSRIQCEDSERRVLQGALSEYFCRHVDQRDTAGTAKTDGDARPVLTQGELENFARVPLGERLSELDVVCNG